MNISSLFLNFTGIVVGPLLKKFNPRILIIIGSTCVGAGLILCSFATQLWHFLLTYSLMVGFGLGVISPSAFYAIQQYFTTRKGQAVGLASAGTGIGQVILPYIVSFLLQNYGFSSAVIWMGVLALTGIIGGILIKPLSTVVDQTENVVEAVEKRRGIRGFFSEIAQKMDLKLLKDFSFLSLAIGLGLAYAASINFAIIYPFYLQVSKIGTVLVIIKSESILRMWST